MTAWSLDELSTHWMTAIKNVKDMNSDIERIEQRQRERNGHLRIDTERDPPPENAEPDMEKYEIEAQNILI